MKSSFYLIRIVIENNWEIFREKFRPIFEELILISRRLIIVGIVLLVIVSLVICAILIFFPSNLPEYLRNDLSNRITLAQLTIEVAGISALLLAAWELYQRQRSPKLRVWITNISEENGQKNEIVRRITTHHAMPTEDGLGFYFRLYIENYGNAPARWVRISLNINSFMTSLFALSPASPLFDKWAMGDENDTIRWTFHGGDDFIVYDRPKSVKSIDFWLEPIGDFMLEIPVDKQMIIGRYLLAKLNCTIQADNYLNLNDAIWFDGVMEQTDSESHQSAA